MTAFQGSAQDYADFVTANGEYTLQLTLRQLSEEKPAKPLGWYLYQANFTVNFEPQATLSAERATQGDVVAILLTGILDGTPEGLRRIWAPSGSARSQGAGWATSR